MMLTAGLVYNDFEQNLQNGKWINDNLKSYFLLLMTLTSRTILVIRFAEFQPYNSKNFNLFHMIKWSYAIIWQVRVLLVLL